MQGRGIGPGGVWIGQQYDDSGVGLRRFLQLKQCWTLDVRIKHPDCFWPLDVRPKSRQRLPPVLLALAEYRPNGRNCRDQSDCAQSSPNRFSLFCAEPVSQKQGDACSDHSPCHDDEREFWSGKLDLLHNSKTRRFLGISKARDAAL
jgi:hypothetical protein